jgi:zinc/manganese transport system permease protein
MEDSASFKDFLEIMTWPLVACVLLPGILVYYGLHIVRRGVIFVDLALAQVAALGICVSILTHHDAHDWQTLAWSFAFTLIGAAIFTLTRRHDHHVPQEALIGIVYVVAAAAAIVLLSGSPHGAEELKETLVGDMLYIQSARQVFLPFSLYAAIGIFHFIFRKRMLMISFEPERAVAEGVSIKWWDFLFYALFGLVVTTFVHIGGVLMIFSYLIVPAVCANFLARSLGARLIIGLVTAVISGAVGLYASVRFNWPVGPSIIVSLGAALLVVATITRLRGAR